MNSRAEPEHQHTQWLYTTRAGTGHLHFGSEINDVEQRYDTGISLGKTTLMLHSGRGRGESSLSHTYDYLDPMFFHGGTYLRYESRGATLGLDLTRYMSTHAGFYEVKADGADDRSTALFAITGKRWHGQMLRVKRDATTVAHGIDLGWRRNAMSLRMQSFRTETRAHSTRLSFAYTLANTKVMAVELQRRTNPLYGLNDDARVMLTFGGRIGHRPGAIFNADATDESAEGEAERKSKRTRGLIVAGAAVGGALALSGSSGDSDNDSSGRFSTQRGAAFTFLNGVNPRSVREDREFGGWVYRHRDGTYSNTRVLRGQPRSINLAPALKDIPSGLRATASMHTHAAFDPNYVGEEFSPTDIRSDRAFGVDGYLGTPSGRLRFHELRTGRIVDLGQIAN